MPLRACALALVCVLLAPESARAQQPADTAAAISPDSALVAPPADSGEATYYHDALHQRRTASGERMDQEALVAAHRRYPFGTLLRVTNLRNGRSVVVRVIDRGPFGSRRNMQRTIVDLSRRAARELGFIRQGRTKVRVEVLDAEPRGTGQGGTGQE